MLNRLLIDKLTAGLDEMPSVALLGARQIGKTTLAKQLAGQTDSIYLDLQSPEDLVKLTDPANFLATHKDKLIILDEIQCQPDLFMTLRGLIDKNRAEGRKVNQFLLLGSASMDLLRQSSESLAGRIRHIDMGGINVLEIGANSKDIQNLWLRGGFPESTLNKTDARAMQWLEDFIRTYLERDIAQMGFNVSAVTMRNLWTMCAHVQGEPANHAKLADNLGVDGKTITRYIGILVDLLLVRKLQPLHTNVKKRLVKAPRYYIRDSGIVHRLLGINSFDALLGHPVLGKSWEGFVIENIHAVLPNLAQSYFYRTADGAEVDLVIKMPTSGIWAIEIKFGSAPKLSKHFDAICNDIGADKKYVVYGGDDEFPIGDGVSMISLHRLMARIAAES